MFTGGKVQKDGFIEAWRGIGVLLVLAYHYTDRVPFAAVGATEPPSVIFHSGKIGVLIFLAISGFLIAASIGQSKSLASFYAKRVSRLWPLFIAASITVYLVMLILPAPVVPDGPKEFNTGERDLVDLAGSLFFLYDLGFNWMDGAYWSILVELKFYFIIGIFAALWPGDFARRFGQFTFAVCSLQSLMVVFAPGHTEIPVRLMNGLVVARYLPFFAVGVLLYKGGHRPLLTALIFLSCVNTLLIVGANPDFSVANTMKFLLLLGLIIAADAVLLGSRVMLFFGKYSYAIYLFHQMIGLAIINLLVPAMPLDLAIPLAFVLVLGLSVIQARLFEWRFRTLFHDAIYKLLARIGLDRVILSKPAGIRPTKGEVAAFLDKPAVAFR